MQLYSAGALPANARVQRTFDMIVHSEVVSLGKPRQLTESSTDAVRQRFIAKAPAEANAILGVQLATNVILYDIGSGGEVHLTFAGNPAYIEAT